MNPARSIATALYGGPAALEQLWVFILAPLADAALAGFTHRTLFTRTMPHTPTTETAPPQIRSITMAGRNTLIRSMHDLGLAAWFGGNLMGAVGLNGAAGGAKDPVERLTLAALGWKKWAPLQLGALAVHAIGGIGLIGANKGRLATQKEGRTNTSIKLALTFLAAGTTLWSGIAGKRLADHSDEGTDGTTEPDEFASKALASAQNQLKILQWATPVLTGTLIVLAAQRGEQQRPVAGRLKSTKKHR